MYHTLYSYPVKEAVFVCPYCGKIIASGNYAIGIYLNGQDIFSPPERIAVLGNKANCCLKGKNLPVPFILRNLEQTRDEIMKLYEREGPNGFDPGMFVEINHKFTTKGNFL